MNEDEGPEGRPEKVRRSAQIVDLAKRRDTSFPDASRGAAQADAVDRVLNSTPFERLIRAIIRQNKKRGWS